MDFGDGGVGEDIGVGSRHVQVVQDIGFGFCFIQMWEMATDVESLKDGGIDLSA